MLKKASEILLQRLRTECGLDIPDDAKIVQVRKGEWRWRLSLINWGNMTGSFWTVSKLAKTKGTLYVYDLHGDQEIWIKENH